MSYFVKFAGAVMATAVTLTSIAPSSGVAAIREHKKIGQLGSPFEWQLKCVKWAIYHRPEVRGLRVKMVKREKCIGHAYKNLQHEFFLVANGPDVGEAAKRVIREALGVAAGAAVGTGLLIPSPEPGARIATAVAVGKAAFVRYLAARGLDRLASQYDIRIDHRKHW